METQVTKSNEMPRELIYLSQKSTHLNSPGTMLSSLYYSRLNSTIETVESTSSLGRYRQGLTSKSFGSSSQVQIPNGSMLGSTYLHLELPNLVQNQTLCRGWGFAAIREISYLFGSSNVSEITIPKHSILHAISLQSETQDKMSELFRLGGEEILGPLNPAFPNEDTPIIEANIQLPLPWSSVNGIYSKKPYDTNLLSQPITIAIVFENGDSFYGGTGARPTAFLKAEIFVRQTDITNRDLSLKTKLIQSPNLTYNYPFTHYQGFQTQRFTGIRPSQGGKVSLPIQSFINSDLSGIVLSVVRTSQLKSIASSSPSPFNSDRITDVELKLNGQTIYYAPGTSYRIANMYGTVGACYFHNSVIGSATAAPFSSSAVDTYFVFIDFSLLRPDAFHGFLQNTFRIPQQTMNLEFNTASSDEYQCFLTYVYGSCVAATQANGQTSILMS